MWHVATMATIITLHFWNKMSGRRLNNTARSRATNSGAGRNANASGKVFNPRLIFSQIVALQCFHYLVLGFMFQINHVLYNNSVTIDRMFTDKFLNLWSIGGWADNAAVLLSSLVWYVQSMKWNSLQIITDLVTHSFSLDSLFQFGINVHYCGKVQESPRF
jgi:hypothetical protein